MKNLPAMYDTALYKVHGRNGHTNKHPTSSSNAEFSTRPKHALLFTLRLLVHMLHPEKAVLCSLHAEYRDQMEQLTFGLACFF